MKPQASTSGVVGEWEKSPHSLCTKMYVQGTCQHTVCVSVNSGVLSQSTHWYIVGGGPYIPCANSFQCTFTTSQKQELSTVCVVEFIVCVVLTITWPRHFNLHRMVGECSSCVCEMLQFWYQWYCRAQTVWSAQVTWLEIVEANDMLCVVMCDCECMTVCVCV